MESTTEYKTLETAYKGDELFKTKKEEELEEKIRELKKELENKFETNDKLTKENNAHKPDSIVNSVINKFMERSKMGKEKYGTDLDRTDLSLYEWIIHAQEEHMDAILYLEKIKQVIVKN